MVFFDHIFFFCIKYYKSSYFQLKIESRLTMGRQTLIFRILGHFSEGTSVAEA